MNERDLASKLQDDICSCEDKDDKLVVLSHKSELNSNTKKCFSLNAKSSKLKINNEMSEIPTSKKRKLDTNEFEESDNACVNSNKSMVLMNKCLNTNKVEGNLKVASCPVKNLNTLSEKTLLVQQIMDNSKVLFSSTLPNISDTTKKLKMPNTEIDSTVIKIIENVNVSCSKSDLDTQMEDFEKLLNSTSFDNENAVNIQKSSEVCKQLVKSIKVKSDPEVSNCNSTNEIMTNDKSLYISSEIHSNVSIPNFTFSTESSCDESCLDSEIKAFYNLVKSEPIEIIDASLNNNLHCTDLELEPNMSNKCSTINPMLENQTDISENKYVVPESGKGSESNLGSGILESSTSEVTVCDDNSDEINLDPIEGNSSIYNKCLILISKNLDIPQPSNVCSVKDDHTSGIDDNYEQDTVKCSTSSACSIKDDHTSGIDEKGTVKCSASNACSVKDDHTSGIDEKGTVKCSTSKVACEISKIEESKVLGTALLKHTKSDNSGKNKQKPVKLKTDETFKSPIKKDSVGNESVTNKIGQNKADPSRDFYEKEKDDVIDPRWQHVKELSTNEQRYQQVKSCWGSTTVPDPDRNLTYHSYRKRQFQTSKLQNNPIRQHKRQASTKLVGNGAKRLRPCTYLFDDKITAIAKEKEEQTTEIMKEMKSRIRNIDIQHNQKKVYLQNLLPSYYHMGYNFHSSSFLNLQLTNLQLDHQRQVACIRDEYQRTIRMCDAKYRFGLTSLTNIRNEVLQFYSFYKGTSKHTKQDPTLLNNSQLQELDDIENFYSQMDNYYK